MSVFENLNNLFVGCGKVPYEELISAEYAQSPDRLTQKECEEILGLKKSACDVLTDSLGYGKDGFLSAEEQTRLQSAGFDRGIIRALAGDDGKNSLRMRARWLAENAVTQWWRWDYNPPTRANLIKELGEIAWHGAQSVCRVDGHLNASEDYDRDCAALALGKIGIRDGIPILIQALKNAIPDIRREAAFALVEMDEKPMQVISILMEGIDDADISIRDRAVESIVRFGRKALSALESALLHPSWVRRAYAVRAIGGMGEAGVPPLIRALKDSEKMVRLEAVVALEKIGKPGISALREALTPF